MISVFVKNLVEKSCSGDGRSRSVAACSFRGFEPRIVFNIEYEIKYLGFGVWGLGFRV